jgi:DNA topoisomerase-2
MKPWFDKFTGRVFSNEDGLWITEGVWKSSSKNISITELPPGRWTQDYKEYLDTLIEKKNITNYVNNSTTDTVDFTIEGYTGKDVVKDFKLQKTFHVSNMHLFHPVKGIHKYESPEEILIDFVKIRTETYKKRKTHLINTLKEKVKKLKNTYKFISMVIQEKLKVFKRKRSELESEMNTMFNKIENSYDYLLNIKTYQYTHEAVESLKGDTLKTIKELEVMENTNYMDMWKKDLKMLT